MKLKQLTADQVEFQVSYQQDDLLVRGNALASGDAQADKECEDAILARLNAGDELAWCCITVTAAWNGFTASAHLGGCGLDNEQQVAEEAEAYGMKEEALANLNKAVAAAYAQLWVLIEE